MNKTQLQNILLNGRQWPRCGLFLFPGLLIVSLALFSLYPHVPQAYGQQLSASGLLTTASRSDDPEIVQIAGGALHTCAVSTEGQLSCWGSNLSGQLGTGNTRNSGTPIEENILPAETDIRAVATGGFHTCVLTTLDDVQCWGNNASGQLGNGTTTDSLTPQLVTGLQSAAVAISAGYDHQCAYTAEGTVYCWGANEHGQIGNGTKTNRLVPTVVRGLPNNVISIAAGVSHTCALTVEDSVWCWGYNNERQVDSTPALNRLLPVEIEGLPSGKVQLALGKAHTCVLTEDGNVICWGDNGVGQLGSGSTEAINGPIAVRGFSGRVLAIVAGSYFTCALVSTPEGRTEIQCWGGNWAGQLGSGHSGSLSLPSQVIGLGGQPITLAAGEAHACATVDNRQVLCWGSNAMGQLGNDVAMTLNEPTRLLNIESPIVDLSAGAWHNCTHTLNGLAYCWGANWAAQIGDGLTDNRSSPTLVEGLVENDPSEQVTQIATGPRHSCAITSRERIACWGANDEGQLGNGTRSDVELSAVAVTNAPMGSTALALGNTHSCALTESGTVYCWGINEDGQLGVGNLIKRSNTPLAVEGLAEGALAIVAGERHTCVLLKTKAVQCWGSNESVQLGDGTIEARWTPVFVEGLPNDVIAIAGGADHNCALTEDKTLYCWGSNWAGQLGDGSQVGQWLPVEVSDLSNRVTAVVAGGYHTCAEVEDGDLYCWGWNRDGQLGDGTYTTQIEPTKVLNPPDGISGLAAGSSHTCAYTEDSELFCWGGDYSGQLGLGRSMFSTTPVAAFSSLTLIHLPYISNTLAPTPTPAPAQPTWQPFGLGPTVVTSLGRNGEQLFAGDRGLVEAGGGLYSRPLTSCSPNEPFTRIDSVTSGVLSVDFSSGFGLAAAFNEHIFTFDAVQNLWTQTAPELTAVYTVATADTTGYAGANNTVYQSADGGATWQPLIQLPSSLNVIERNTNRLLLGTDGSGVQEHRLGFNVLFPLTTGLTTPASLQVWDIYVDQSTFYLATYDGVYAGDGITAWQRMGSNLAGVEARSLAIFEGDLYVGTLGSGVYRLPVAEPSGVWEPVTTTPANSATWIVRDLLPIETPCQGLLAATNEGVWLLQTNE